MIVPPLVQSFVNKSKNLPSAKVIYPKYYENSKVVVMTTFYLKFLFSKKATKIEEIFTVYLTLHNVKLTVKISSIFVAFLENMNFNWHFQRAETKRKD